MTEDLVICFEGFLKKDNRFIFSRPQKMFTERDQLKKYENNNILILNNYLFIIYWHIIGILYYTILLLL